MEANENEFISVYMSFDNVFTPEECLRLLKHSNINDIYSKITYIINEINKNYFKFDINKLPETKVVEINVDTPQEWITDIAENSAGKISFIIFLSATSDYKNCQVIFSLTKDIPEISQNIGTLLLFPSYRPYKIIPPEDGKMYILKGCMYGTPFR